MTVEVVDGPTSQDAAAPESGSPRPGERKREKAGQYVKRELVDKFGGEFIVRHKAVEGDDLVVGLGGE